VICAKDPRLRSTTNNNPRFVTHWVTSAIDRTGEGCDLLSSVALLCDLPECGLVRGQVGTIVEPLDEATALVEFSDDEGRAYAIVPCPREALLILCTAPLAA
jgi:hypothetical protein